MFRGGRNYHRSTLGGVLKRELFRFKSNIVRTIVTINDNVQRIESSYDVYNPF